MITFKSTSKLFIAHLGDGLYRVARRRGRSPMTGKFLRDPISPQERVAAQRARNAADRKRNLRSAEKLGLDYDQD